MLKDDAPIVKRKAKKVTRLNPIQSTPNLGEVMSPTIPETSPTKIEMVKNGNRFKKRLNRKQVESDIIVV